MPNLIFLFSLPRSGSTLLQRLLAVHPDIETAAEPWLLLPQVYTLRKSAVYAEFSWDSLTNAVTDLIETLPGKHSDYFAAIRAYADSIYSRITFNDSKYFLDKTPRYYFIIKEISKIYPDAKFIFLFRNPLAMYSSVIQSFNGGFLGNVKHRIDIFEGPFHLVEGYKYLQDRSFSLRFEDMVANPEPCMRALCDYLGIQYTEEFLKSFCDIRLKGRMGDQFGTNKYQSITKETTDKWKETFSTVLRKQHAKHFIQYLGRDVVSMMGYSYDDILCDINSLPGKYRFLIQDLYFLTRCTLFSLFENFLFAEKLFRRNTGATKKRKLYVHS